MKCALILGIAIIISASLLAQNRIHINGDFSDWDNIKPLYSDVSGDNQTGKTDFGKIWITNDEFNLIICFETGSEINLQNGNDIALYIDTDNNASTGKEINGIGAEFEWIFGLRKVFFNSVQTTHDKIGLITTPTVSSDKFEIAIRSDAIPAGSIELFKSDTISIVFESAASGDTAPDKGLTIKYVFNRSHVPALKKINIQKQSNSHLRVMTYNVLRDNFLKKELTGQFSRILEAIQPEIIGFEEIYNANAKKSLSYFKSIASYTKNSVWYSSKVEPDIVLVSKFPILETFSINGYNKSNNNGAFIVDLTDRYDSKLLIIVAHPPCCNNDKERQEEIDAIMSFVRDAKTNGGNIDIDINTPIIIMGDMNLVGDSRQLNTFLKGNIANEDNYGYDFNPDWDDSNMEDLIPRHTETPYYFTWYDDKSSFYPGRLDFMFYTNSILKKENAFILFTPGMSQENLKALNLRYGDVIEASDHLPVVADFSILPLNTDILK